MKIGISFINDWMTSNEFVFVEISIRSEYEIGFVLSFSLMGLGILILIVK
jgi:hypothetical protein